MNKIDGVSSFVPSRHTLRQPSYFCFQKNTSSLSCTLVAGSGVGTPAFLLSLGPVPPLPNPRGTAMGIDGTPPALASGSFLIFLPRQAVCCAPLLSYSVREHRCYHLDLSWLARCCCCFVMDTLPASQLLYALHRQKPP